MLVKKCNLYVPATRYHKIFSICKPELSGKSFMDLRNFDLHFHWETMIFVYLTNELYFRFTEILVKIRNRHSNVVETMAQVGVVLWVEF